MANETISPPTAEGQSMTGLVSGIVTDAQELVKQQLALVRAEIKADLQRTARASALLTAGAVVAVPALFLLCEMLVYMLHELAGFSHWASDGIVGGAFALIAAALVLVGVQRFRSFNPLPDQSAEAIKENVRWMTNPK
jgi:hypothetical protein